MRQGQRVYPPLVMLLILLRGEAIQQGCPLVVEKRFQGREALVVC